MKILLLIASIITLLSGCASIGAGTFVLDRSKTAISQESRVRFLILHYTALDQPTSLRVLTEQGVSSHYLIGDDAAFTVYQLVDENRAAYHAGVSEWKGQNQLNGSSIGIEIVNLGYHDSAEGRTYAPFPPAQIERLIALMKQIIARHAIKPENILGHAEIAPQRKPDPGPLFPWQRLADAGLVAWPDAALVKCKTAQFEQQLPDINWFQQRLSQHGYAVAQSGDLDAATRNVLKAFQTRYRPQKYDGTPDAATAALLDVLAIRDVSDGCK